MQLKFVILLVAVVLLIVPFWVQLSNLLFL